MATNNALHTAPEIRPTFVRHRREKLIGNEPWAFVDKRAVVLDGKKATIVHDSILISQDGASSLLQVGHHTDNASQQGDAA